MTIQDAYFAAKAAPWEAKPGDTIIVGESYGIGSPHFWYDVVLENDHDQQVIVTKRPFGLVRWLAVRIPQPLG